MPTQSEVEKWWQDNPAPERPPNVGSDEREAWKDAIGEPEAIRRMKAWQAWWNKENDFQQNAVAEAWQNMDWEQALQSLGYRDELEHGASVFAKFRQYNDEAQKAGYKDYQERRGREGWNGIKDSHYGVDPVSGLYVNPPGGETNWLNFDWRDAKGFKVAAPAKSRYNTAGYDNTNPSAPALNSVLSTPQVTTGDPAPAARRIIQDPASASRERESYGLSKGIPGLNKRRTLSGLGY